MKTAFHNSRLGFAVLLIISGILSTNATQLGADEKQGHVDKNYLLGAPVWANQGKVENEPLLFVRSAESGRPRAMLLFAPKNLLKVHTALGDAEFPPSDFVIDGRSIEYVGTAALPVVERDDLIANEKTERSIAYFSDGKRYLLFSEGSYFHRLQVAVEYSTKERWAGPKLAATHLLNLDRKIQHRVPIKIVLLGDSISLGANASSRTKVPPFQAPYIGLFAEKISRLSGCPVSVSNLSSGGKTSAWGVTQINAVVESKPDVVVIAFGMNDASGRVTRERFEGNVRSIIERVKEALPNAELVLVAGMSANPDWSKSGIQLHDEYRLALAELAGPRVVFCDVQSIWDYLVSRKGFLSLTGNGVNHPNDFGHRVYADCLAATLLGP